MSFFTEISQTLFDFMNKNGKALDPSRVTDNIIKSARKEARSWGNDSKPEIPNLFVVSVGTEDWNAYYGQRPEDIAREVAYHVMRKAHSKGLYLASDPVISFEEDATIPKGRCRVNAQFNFEERERLRREPMDFALPEEEQADQAEEFDLPEPYNQLAQQPTPMPALQATVAMQPIESAPEVEAEQEPQAVTPAAAATTVMSPVGETQVIGKIEDAAPDPPAAVTCVLQQPIIPEARLEGSDVSVRVFHDCTIGVVRKPKAEVQPDVSLQYEQFPYCSHIQGKFAYTDGVWRFLNVGRNGTRVQMHDQDILLEPGMNCVIPYDSWIIFARGLPLRFVKSS